MIVAAIVAGVVPVMAGSGRSFGVISDPPDALQLAREQAVKKAAGFGNWPQNSRLTAAPVIDRSFLSDADFVTRESRSHGALVMEGIECGTLDLQWDHRAPSTDPPPADLPPLARASLERRKGEMAAEEWRRYYQTHLERYRASKARTTKGWIRVKMLAAPSSRAAQEWLVYDSTICTLPTRGVAAEFAPAHRVKDLGDVGFVCHDRLARFTRGNIAVYVRGDGDGVPEVEALAHKIDKAIEREPALTSFEAARPTLTLGPLRFSPDGRTSTLAVQASAPGDWVSFFTAWVDGRQAAVRDGEVRLGTAKGQLTVKVRAMTDGLLVRSVETTLGVGQAE